MSFFFKYMVKRFKMCFKVDHRTVKIVNMLVCLAWILSLLISPNMAPILPMGLEFDNHELWIAIFSGVGIANLTAITTEHVLSKHYAFLSSVVLWASLSVSAYMSAAPVQPACWIYGFMACLSAVAYWTIDNSELEP